ncbi:MAG TPA: Gfo/Idh/MocA family oxidoreductase [Tepidisphaeraceae bacterium]|jgi:predicted dehydrogenase
MPHRSSRRRFLQQSAFAGLSVWVSTRPARAAKSPNEKLDIGVIGVSNRGAANLSGVASQNLVALCDVDDRYLDVAMKKDAPKAQRFNDFRRMLDQVKNLDAIVVSAADHCHAPATVRALRLGKHVYCEKPLTHTVAEARLVATEAAKAKRATQLGTQIHAGDNYRRVVEVIRSGAIGPVRRVHVFVTSRYGLSPAIDKAMEPPPAFHWDLWLGPAPQQPYKPFYHPQQWRHFWDFGGGTLADFGCHHLDLSFWALDLLHPTTVEAHGPDPDPVHPPDELTVDYHFPARGEQPPVQITWSQGIKRPSTWDELGAPKWGNGTLFVGDKGLLIADYGRYQLLPKDKFGGFQPPPQSIPKSIGHHEEWIKACKEGTPTLCHFGYGGALTETALLGNVAHRAGNKKLDWDARRLTTNDATANSFLTREYRKGWEL